jgi:hypothetical protein
VTDEKAVVKYYGNTFVLDPDRSMLPAPWYDFGSLLVLIDGRGIVSSFHAGNMTIEKRIANGK